MYFFCTLSFYLILVISIHVLSFESAHDNQKYETVLLGGTKDMK